jgi:hypothetical protein
VLSTIDFDDELPLPTDKVHDVWPDGFLPDEFAAINRARPKAIPKLRFSGSRILP